MKTKVHLLNGEVIHVGEWEPIYQVDPQVGSAPFVRDDLPPLNPIPEGAVEIEADIAWTADGRVVLADSPEAEFVDNKLKVTIS